MCKRYEVRISAIFFVEFETDYLADSDELREQALDLLPSEIKDAADEYEVTHIRPVGKKR